MFCIAVHLLITFVFAELIAVRQYRVSFEFIVMVLLRVDSETIFVSGSLELIYDLLSFDSVVNLLFSVSRRARGATECVGVGFLEEIKDCRQIAGFQSVLLELPKNPGEQRVELFHIQVSFFVVEDVFPGGILLQAELVLHGCEALEPLLDVVHEILERLVFREVHVIRFLVIQS